MIKPNNSDNKLMCNNDSVSHYNINNFSDGRHTEVKQMCSLPQDSWQCIRESVHVLLGSCTLTTAASLLGTVEALLDNIRRYPQVRHTTVVTVWL